MTFTESKSKPLTARVDHGFLIARIEVNSLMHESAIRQVETELLKELPNATTAMIIDCEELTLHVSTEFLSTLVYVRKVAEKRGVALALCNLSNSLLASHEATALSPLILAFDSLREAMLELGYDGVGESDHEAAISEGRALGLSRSQVVGVIAASTVVAVLALGFGLSRVFPF